MFNLHRKQIKLASAGAPQLIIISIILLYYKEKKLYTKTAAKEAVLLPVESSSDDDPGFRHGFGAEASLPLIQGAPAVSHNTTRLYLMVFNLYECHIHSDAVRALFWIIFIYSLFFVSPILVKNVEVAFKIKPRHPISRGNMFVDQSFLVHVGLRTFPISADAPCRCWSRKGSLILR